MDPRNRFMSGLPAHLTARALGLGGAAYSVDAACASSLVALEIACARLHDRQDDVMIAGAVNRADDLFIHTGFCALGALSKTGRSRPFHAEADGLIPAEGAGVLVLQRLSDAVSQGRQIYGVIRGVGTSNDGRGSGLLVPARSGQEAAMRRAFEGSGLTPSDVSLLECHATGTTIGDKTEIESTGTVYADADDLPVGSLKSNMGHLITAAGVAGVIKVLEAQRHGVRPPSLWADQQNPALSNGSLRVLTQPEAWPGRRVAGVSAFGFGGNNAHVLIEPYDPTAPLPRVAAAETRREALAITGLAVLADVDEAVLPLGKVRFPPRDLEQTLGQQLLLLQAALQATEHLELDQARTSVLVGMGCDAEVARYGARWRLPGWQKAAGQISDDATRDAVVPLLQSAGVIGTMPNIPANRINSQLDLRGASMSVSSEELSGIRALQIAAQKLRHHHMDAAIVGAVDLSCEPVHEAAKAQLGLDSLSRDAAVVLVVERLRDAQAKRHPIIAILDDVQGQPRRAPPAGAHAASGLLAIADTALNLREGEVVTMRIDAMENQTAQVTVVGGPAQPATASVPERAMRYPLHQPAVSLPHFEAAAPTGVQTMSDVQTMAPAPALESILTPAGVTPSPAPAAVHIPAPVAPAIRPIASPNNPVLQQLAEQTARVSAIHRSYLTQQAEVQRRFLALRQQGAAQLLNRPVAIAPAVLMPASMVAALPPAITRAPQIQARAVVPTLPISVPAPAVAPVPVRTAPAVVPRPAAAPIVKAALVTRDTPTGPAFSREQLEVHASGKISTIFGPLFEQQDGWDRQVRMPTPPLLLCDRVTGIDGQAGTMGKGTIWTETDVEWDSWYLHEGRMPAGVMIESGQADLMLISWLGADFHNKGDRMYRLLGCQLTYHGGLPQPGDTLKYDIHVDGHAAQGDIRLFFFHYDCKVDGQKRLSVREGQAGFFNEAELAESAGVLWSAEEFEPCANPRLDAPVVECTRTSLTHKQLQAFSEGNVLDCFGPGFELACPHTRTPRISGGRMLWLEEVTHLERQGGPWGRGYLRAIDTIAPDDWFFDGHFQNDPCMPGTMMFEGCLQAMSVFATSLGYTLDKDGWVFEPVPDQPYDLRCRGEVDPDSKELIYEIFVEEIEDGPHPTIWADLLCTVDGLKAFHCKRMGMRLVPAFPLDSRPDLPGPLDSIPVAEHEGFRFDYKALLACAWGQPSLAFGKLYQPFDAIGKVPRLPSPPYHFMTRVTEASGVGVPKAGATVTVEYDIPDDVWYFRENGAATMPFCVLLEAALQPCGWLASGVGSIVGEAGPLFFRNLDGTGTLHRELLPGDGTLRTNVKLTSVSKSAGMIIESFEVECLVGDELIYDMSTVFGFFPGEALANQVGMSTTDEQREFLNAPCDEIIDLRMEPERYFGEGKASLPAPFLRVIDKVDGIWRDGGEAGLGRYRSTKAVDANEWYFKAHFHQDPVQPGSLGIEAMIQLLQFAMLDKGLDAGIEAPRFEPIGLADALTWKYRGQVRAHNKTVNATVEITEQGSDERGPFLLATASLWTDGMRIYEASNLGMRITSGVIDTSLWTDTLRPDGAEAWVRDHCPTWTVPALPMTCMVDRLAQAASGEGRLVIGLEDVRVKRWLVVDENTDIRADVKRGDEQAHVTLYNDDGPIASGTVLLGCAWTMGPAPLKPLAGDLAPNPYETGALFHGPAFQVQQQLCVGDTGSSALLDATPGPVPMGVLNPRLLDGATHGIPHDRLDRWCPEIDADQVAYPALITRLSVHGQTPAEGTVRCEVRFAGFHGGPRFPAFDVQLITGDRVWATFRLVEALFPKGPIGMADNTARRAFLRDRTWADVTLSLALPDGTT
ncbi:MAG: 3-oxoacyl-(acyl-carrier-protein) synthase/3-hydroxymyristoyl, partial [Myxococcota bacterium]